MWDRLFGRDKDEGREPACAACGRTLLPGEWAQTVVGDSGREEVICSLCAQSGVASETASPTDDEVAPQPQGPITVSGRPQPIKPRAQRDLHEDSDAFWRALKDKDAEIARLQGELVAATTQSQRLAAQVSLLERQLRGETVTDWQVAAPFEDESGGSAEPTMPAAAELDAADEEPVETAPATGVEETAPDEAIPQAAGSTQPLTVDQDAEVSVETEVAEAAEVLPQAMPDLAAPAGDNERTAAIPVAAATPAAVDEAAAVEGPSWLFDTPPHQTFGDSARAQVAFAAATAADSTAQALESEETTGTWEAHPSSETSVPPEPADLEQSATQQAPDAVERSSEVAQGLPMSPPVEELAPSVTEPDEEPELATPEELEAEARMLAVLQRGADLLNVSQAPRKVAETSQSLGIPNVQLSSDEETVTAVFLWSMAWYRFDVDLSSGEVALKERGYEDRADLMPNAKVRADGTVQVLPLPTRRAALRPATRQEPQASAAPDAQAPLPGKGDFISGSLMGQRTDDEPAAWDETSSRDFDWGR